MRIELKDKVARQNCAVVLVDLQNDFCHQKGAWGKIVADPDFRTKIEGVGALENAAGFLETGEEGGV